MKHNKANRIMIANEIKEMIGELFLRMSLSILISWLLNTSFYLTK